MKHLSLIIFVLVLCLVILVSFAACKPTTSGNSDDGSSTIVNNSFTSNGEGAVSTDSAVSTDNTSNDAISSDYGATNSTSSETTSINLGDNVFEDNWD